MIRDSLRKTQTKNHTNPTEVTQMKAVWEEPDTVQATLLSIVDAVRHPV